MASISREAGGKKTIQFAAGDGRRKSIRLGKASMKTAEAVKVRVEILSAAVDAGHPPDAETLVWLEGLTERMTNKLANVGLVERRRDVTLKEFLDEYAAGRTDVKASTKTFQSHTQRNLLDYFGENKPLREITPGDADQWRTHLIGTENLADNTVRRRCSMAKQLFKAGVRRRFISANPFADLTGSVRANPSRFYFVTREEADKVLEACPDDEWRLLFALSRYGGLRCPSEHLSLKWGDIDWENGRIRVHSPKTEHHVGGESRMIPLFPELRPYLDRLFDKADEGPEHIITRYRDRTQNLRTHLERIIKRAGLKPWPKLFQNLRSTRETELAETFPMHVVCAWIGNSQAVAAKHYLQVTDSHFAQGSALQNPVQSNAVLTGNASHEREDSDCDDSDAHEKTSEIPEVSTDCDASRDEIQYCQVGDAGLEPATSRM